MHMDRMLNSSGAKRRGVPCREFALEPLPHREVLRLSVCPLLTSVETSPVNTRILNLASTPGEVGVPVFPFMAITLRTSVSKFTLFRESTDLPLI